MRYKKTPLSCSFNTILDEELEVAECLILLSKSSPKFVVDGVKLAGEAMDAVHERASGFLRHKKLRKDAEIEFGFVSIDQKLGEERNVEHLLITRKQSNDEGLGLLSAVPFTVGVKFY
ncbi:hypothetical protein Bca4012_047932 [Brassica carinata]